MPACSVPACSVPAVGGTIRVGPPIAIGAGLSGFRRLSTGTHAGAVGRARERGLDASHIHLRHIWPLPRNLGDLLRSYERIIVPEMNKGQLKTLLRDQFLVDARPVNKVSGQPFKIAEIEAAIEAALG